MAFRRARVANIQKDSENNYAKITKIFHWLRLVLLVLIYLSAWGDGLVGLYFNHHKLFGSILFVVVIMNILWRLFNNYPKSSAGSVLEKNIQMIIYIFIYTILLISPILGYLGSKHDLDLYLFKIPAIYDFDLVSNFILEEVKVDTGSFVKVMKAIHKVFVEFVLLGLIGAHLLAIFGNMIIKKTNDIKKMI
jgi:cytochrome b561